MRIQPVPGWRVSVGDLGLPVPAPGTGDLTKLTPADPWRSPFVGYLGDHGFFVASSMRGTATQWWLVGIDGRDGRRLFDPVRLSETTRPPTCLRNGPNTVLCVYDEPNSGTAWVVDATTGAVTFTGPTSLRTSPAKLNLKQVGIYAVAETAGDGVYGVGPKAEPTWHVSGDGRTGSSQASNSDLAPKTLFTAMIDSRRFITDVVFSVVDGTVIEPALDAGMRPLRAVTYHGGFAVEFGGQDGRQVGVAFFDPTGKRLAQIETGDWLLPDFVDLPTLPAAAESRVFTPDGQLLVRIPGVNASVVRFMGGRLFVPRPSPEDWKQYDLRTGAEGKECAFDNSGPYLGSDGSVAVFSVGNPDAGLAAKAIDLDTCDKLWTLPSGMPPDVRSYGSVWRLNTTLVQLSGDGTELYSLVAPSK